MGKSEVQSLPIHRPETKLICVPANCKTIDVTHFIDAFGKCSVVDELTPPDTPEERDVEETMDIPKGFEIFSHQVAGHKDGKKYIGMLKQDGTIFKPIIKKECGERELDVYNKLQTSMDRTLIQMKNLVPKYFGMRRVLMNGTEYECLVLEDLIKDFKEPCIMDVKIGKRTWDPEATYEKILSEEKKYHECKKDLGFCIPGFQVYQINTNQLVKYGKEYGNTLTKDRVVDVIRTFLNAENGKVCRSLIVQFLAALWQIQYWVRNQRQMRLYSSSVLLVYDARRLREKSKLIKPPAPLKLSRKGSLYRPMSMAALNNERIPTGFSGQLTKDGPILRTPRMPNKVMNLEVPSCVSNNTWHKSIHTLKRTHSFQNNYDKDVQCRKQDYTYLLDELCTEEKSECWATAKMIDFAHVYPAENCDIDKNYLDGIENLVNLFEEFLFESD
ncbi:unnamed protein product [Phaedon cochleariae]|uniref:Kinase n=1 Tax=Phaedon cochleariae TaxID=80249 RepID=A0A9P0D8Q6_PHACE|nr:unnamed protein product [Phaedon cochleariae]